MGQTLAGRYRLTSVIANGAAGELWHAVDEGTHRPVAVKLLPPAGGAAWAGSHASGAAGAGSHAGDRLADLLRRARPALSALWHPGIARLLDLVELDSGRLALISDFAPGADLARLLATTLLAPRQAAVITTGMAEALHAAHRAEVVHGDLKPTNVLVAPDGTVRLTDFSLATLLRIARPQQPPAPSPYAPPWLVDSGVPTSSSDVYALGMLLHEMLTGTSTPDAGRASAGIDPSLWDVIDRCLADDRTQPTAGEVAQWLTGLAPHLSPTPPPDRVAPLPRGARTPVTASAPRRQQRRHSRTRLTVGLAAAAALVVAGATATVSATGLLGPAEPTSPPAAQETTATSSTGAPALPDAAAEPTAEGGAEFLQYWFALLTQAVRSGDPATLVEVTSPDCGDCEELVATIAAARTGGGQMRGGSYLVRRVSTADLWTVDRPVYDATIDRSPRTTVDASGAPVATLEPLSFSNCVVVLEWTDDRWSLREVVSPGCVA